MSGKYAREKRSFEIYNDSYEQLCKKAKEYDTEPDEIVEWLIEEHLDEFFI